MDKILLELSKNHHIRRINDNEFSVICSYNSQLEEIEQNYPVTLNKSADSANGLTVWGSFKLNS